MTDKYIGEDIFYRYAKLRPGRDPSVVECEYFSDNKADGSIEIYQSFNCYGIKNCNYDGGPINEYLVDERPNAITDVKITSKFRKIITQVVMYINGIPIEPITEVKTTPTSTPSSIVTPTPVPQVKIYKVNYNAPGDDRYNLNGEYVVIKNYGDAVNLKGWKLRDEYGHTYVFPSVVIPSGGTITIYTGSGLDTQTELYWGRDWPVWNNDGDTAYLYDSSGRLVDSYSWRGYESQSTSALSCSERLEDKEVSYIICGFIINFHILGSQSLNNFN